MVFRKREDVQGWWKRMIAIALVAVVLISAFWGRSQGAESESLRIAKALSEAYAEVAEKIKPAVVGIQTYRNITTMRESLRRNLPRYPGIPEEFFKRFFDIPQGEEETQRISGVGSGVIIDPKGYILTNNHVIEDAERVEVTLADESHFDAKVVGTDPKTDLAVICLIDCDRPLTVAKLGDSDALKVGNIVIAIGSPFRLMQTVTAGIVSAKERSIGMGLMYENFIQTDAAINQGNSGGPLVNLDGEVVGINLAISTTSGGSQGVGFAVPINTAKAILDELIATGKVTRGWLGIGIRDVTPDMAALLPGVKGGVAVREVYAQTPASEGGLEAGDVIVKFDGTPLRNSAQLQELVARAKVGSQVKIDIIRQGKPHTLTITIGKQPDDIDAVVERRMPVSGQKVWASDLLGIEVQTLDEDLKKQMEEYRAEKGVVVTKVTPGSPAGDLGIRPGALILSLDQREVPDIQTFASIVKEIENRKSVLILYRQNGINRFDVLKLRPKTKPKNEAPKEE